MASATIRYEAGRALIRVPLDDSRDEASLGRALDALNALLRDSNVLSAKKHADLDYVVTTFHTPKRKWIRERIFFERCAKHAALHPKMIEYAELVNRPARKLGPALSHGDLHPAGTFAVVPLALADARYIAPLLEHFRSWDMDHESFHPSLIGELLARHGIVEETLDLLAWRAIESDGQSKVNLGGAVHTHELLGKLASFGGIEGFVDRCWRVNRRTQFLPLYIGNAGRALFLHRLDDFQTWLRLFEAKGVVFEDSDRVPPSKVLTHRTPLVWPDCYFDDEETVP